MMVHQEGISSTFSSLFQVDFLVHISPNSP